MRRLKKLLRVATGFIAIYYFVVTATGLLAHPRPADIAVVLGNEVLTSGLPSDRLAARVDCALALYQQKQVKQIMVSGGIDKAGHDEAAVMASYLKSKSVPDSDIIIDSQGVNTMATAVNTAKLMQERHLKSAVVVSQYFHLARSELAFHMAGIDNFSADYPAFYEWRDIPSTLREMVAIPVYWFTHSNSH